MRFHVVGLPHTQVTKQFSACAYTEKVRKFCRMMAERGHEVLLYAGDQSEAPGQLVACFTETDRQLVVGDQFYTSVSFEPTEPHWIAFNGSVIGALRTRLQPGDIICIIAGRAQSVIATAFPQHLCVEFGVGYGGSFSNYRVFESYAWMHVTYGAEGGRNPNAAKGNHWYHEVIPGYLEMERIPAKTGSDNYFLFAGRLGVGKGEDIAIEVANRLNTPLIVVGHGTPPSGSQYLGVVDSDQLYQLMSRAKALIAPTVYIEPFGNVVAEAQACGTPTITTDWGAFSETNIPGVTGFRCRTFREFVAAAAEVENLDTQYIQTIAAARFSLEAVGDRYQSYFERLNDLWGDGWYAL